MINEDIRISLRLAERELQLAEHELNRPHEDVVTLSVCQSVRSSIKDLMRLYLLANGINSHGKMSLQNLMGLCTETNKRFSAVAISDIGCKETEHEHCDHKYCLSIDSVSNCVTAANKLKKIVWEELKLN
jgi:HEPN domain-containing protein